MSGTDFLPYSLSVFSSFRISGAFVSSSQASFFFRMNVTGASSLRWEATSSRHSLSLLARRLQGIPYQPSNFPILPSWSFSDSQYFCSLILWKVGIGSISDSLWQTSHALYSAYLGKSRAIHNWAAQQSTSLIYISCLAWPAKLCTNVFKRHWVRRLLTSSAVHHAICRNSTPSSRPRSNRSTIIARWTKVKSYQ